MCVCVRVPFSSFANRVLFGFVILVYASQSRKGSVTIPAKKALEIVPADAA